MCFNKKNFIAFHLCKIQIKIITYHSGLKSFMTTTRVISQKRKKQKLIKIKFNSNNNNVNSIVCIVIVILI